MYHWLITVIQGEQVEHLSTTNDINPFPVGAHTHTCIYKWTQIHACTHACTHTDAHAHEHANADNEWLEKQFLISYDLWCHHSGGLQHCFESWVEPMFWTLLNLSFNEDKKGSLSTAQTINPNSWATVYFSFNSLIHKLFILRSYIEKRVSCIAVRTWWGRKITDIC